MTSVIANILLVSIVVALIAVISSAVMNMPGPEPLRALETTSTCISGGYSCFP